MKGEYDRAKMARQTKQIQWFQNMSMFFGNQYAVPQRSTDAAGFRDKLVTPRSPYYKRRKTVNRTRSFVRTEHSKFLSSVPHAIAVPATGEDQDMRAAYAGEQAWESLSETGKLRTHFTRASWWTIITGTGFVKAWWDPTVCVDKDLQEYGQIRYGSITPFHLFVPDLREQDIEDQQLVINAYVKPVGWVQHFFSKELEGITIAASTTSANTILEEAYLNLSTARQPDSVTLYEVWMKPGATPLLPDGGVAIMVDDVLVALFNEGLPYSHGMYPFAKFEHIPTNTFYADSPLVDTNNLQREYNQLRTEISEAGTRMARPQLIAQKGSIILAKMTNEPGAIIEYRAGTAPPQPIPLSPLPQYYMDQQDRILADWEDLTGQHAVSKGDAPAGVTAGTAINYLQEKDNDFLLPQYQSIEDGYEKLAVMTLSNFVQYVDMPRKMKTIGADGAFDTALLSGADIKNGTDIRIQKGSAVGESQAAKQAKIMDMFSAGLITDPNVALKLLSMGGTDKIIDLMNVAEGKAQRENIKMKLLKPMDIQMFMMEQAMQQAQAAPVAPAPQALMPGAPQAPMDPNAPPVDTNAPPMDTNAPQMGTPMADPTQAPVADLSANFPGLIIAVDDFDVHPVHIETHNKFRMSQEYDMLPPEVKNQFEMHVKWHEASVASAAFKQFLMQASQQGAPGGPPTPGSPDASLSPSGAPSAPQPTGGP